MKKTIVVAGHRLTLAPVSREDGVEVVGAQLSVKGLGVVQVQVTRVDPERFKPLEAFLAEPRTAMEIQKHFELKTWSAAGRLVSAAKDAGVRIYVKKREAATGHLGRRPMLFCTSVERFEAFVPPTPPRRKALSTAEILLQVSERLERLELAVSHPAAPSAPSQGLLAIG